MTELLRSDLPKIGYNAKFEHRWARKKLRVNVRNWVWDGMLAAHVLDNREATTSLEFQELVQLGVTDHKGAIKPYLQSREPGGNAPNRVREADLMSLLRYNALDSLIEYKLAQRQAEQMEVEL